MDKQTDFLMNISVLYRSTQKYYDRMLQSINITYAQLPILIMIFEHEGISMREIAQSGFYDKGTISKNVKHLEQQGYIHIYTSKQDKRNKELYTSDLAKQNMSTIYSIRRNWWQHLIQHIDESAFTQFIGSYDQLAKNARQYEDASDSQIHFFQWKKVSLNAYPNKIATVLYMAGNNFRSPFDCHPELLFIKEDLKEIPLYEIKLYLRNRRNQIQALSIEGGEPLMNPNLSSFLQFTKKLGYLNKIKTNGTYPDLMIEWIEKKYLDFIDLKIMNSPNQYAKSIGMEKFSISCIDQSLEYLKNGSIDYQCSIYLVKEYHSIRSIEAIAKWLSGIKKLVIYTNIEACNTVQKHLHNIDLQMRYDMIQILKASCENVEVRE